MLAGLVAAGLMAGLSHAAPPTCVKAFITQASPPSGTIDARQPVVLNTSILLGIGGMSEPIILMLDPLEPGPPPTDPACWALCETHDGGLGPNFVAGVAVVGPDTYALVLDRPITANAATVITYLGNPVDEIVFLSHPANSNGDVIASPVDILFVVDMLNGVATPPHGLYSQDMNHDGFFGPSDILRVVDLLNGVSTFPVQLFTFLPSPAPCLAPKLTLEIADLCQSGAGSGGLFEVQLWMRDLAHDATGYQAFVEYDPVLLSFQGGAYTSAPFPLHITGMSEAEVVPGLLLLDGSASLGGSGEDADSLLAILLFEVIADCATTRIGFGPYGPFTSELSFQGLAIPGILVPTSELTLDKQPPVLECPADLVVPGDGGGFAVVFYDPPDVTDVCDDAPMVTCAPVSGSSFPPGLTMVTCTAVDACGLEGHCTFQISVVP